jgi:hypothetical protein
LVSGAAAGGAEGAAAEGAEGAGGAEGAEGAEGAGGAEADDLEEGACPVISWYIVLLLIKASRFFISRSLIISIHDCIAGVSAYP